MAERLSGWALLRSVRLRLAVLLMVAATLLTGAIAAWIYQLAVQHLEHDRAEHKTALVHALVQPMAGAMWNFDSTAAAALLDARLGAMVKSITAIDSRGQVWMQRGVQDDVGTQGAAGHEEVFRIPLPPMEGMPVGTLEVRWSDAVYRESMASLGQALGLQLVLLNVFLFLVFWIGAQRLVFHRVHVLQQALNQAASQKLAADIDELPVQASDEFGALTASINRITTRLRRELEAGQASEEEARQALTNLQNAQEGLVRAEKMAALGSLVAGVAHELNTPIGNIVMVSSTQQERNAEFGQHLAANQLTRKGLESFWGQARDGADMVFHNATRAAELIQSFKQVAVDQTSDRLRSFDLATQISEVLSVTAPVFRQKNITIERVLQPGIAMTTYPGPLGQVLTNLLTNAVVHAFDHCETGTITVRCRASEGTAVVEVQDNGCGMAPEVLGRIFDPFFTTKLGKGGSGLGLHISHNIVYGPLRGRLRVHSAPGQGSTFTVELPCQIGVTP
jgi:signal transduction histidine kinase